MTDDARRPTRRWIEGIMPPHLEPTSRAALARALYRLAHGDQALVLAACSRRWRPLIEATVALAASDRVRLRVTGPDASDWADFGAGAASDDESTVWIVRGLGRDGPDALIEQLKGLNFARDDIMGPHSRVWLWLPPGSLGLMGRVAPDLWRYRSASLELVPRPADRIVLPRPPITLPWDRLRDRAPPRSAPIRDARDTSMPLGRRPLCDALLGALDSGRAVEIIGEPHMGRSDLLRWLDAAARHDARPVVRINARSLPRSTPAALLRAIAEQGGQGEAMHAALTRHSALPDDRDAAAALPLLDGWRVLIDDADALAEPGNGFTGYVFDELRARMQTPGVGIQWVSAAHRPLEGLFRGRGWTSRFLSDAIRLDAGALDTPAVEAAFADRHPPAVAARCLSLAGTLPVLVKRLWDRPDGIEAAMDALPRWAEGIFAAWWQRPEDEQAVLAQATDGIAEDGMDGKPRTLAGRLVRRGLMIETDDGFALNGAAWADHVRRVR